MNFFNIHKLYLKSVIKASIILLIIVAIIALWFIFSIVMTNLIETKESINFNYNEIKLEQVKSENGNFVILPNNLNLLKGNEQQLYVKIVNPTPIEQEIFSGGELSNSYPSSTQNKLTYSTNNGDVESYFSIFTPEISLQPSQIQAIPILLNIDESTPNGNYFLNFEIVIDDNMYSEVITVVVN
jgi:hypothetical protein